MALVNALLTENTSEYSIETLSEAFDIAHENIEPWFKLDLFICAVHKECKNLCNSCLVSRVEMASRFEKIWVTSNLTRFYSFELE